MKPLAPEEIELNKKRKVLERLKDRLATSEEDMADLRAELEQFEARYTMEVGRLYAELDDIDAQIAEKPGQHIEHRDRAIMARRLEINGQGDIEPVPQHGGTPPHRVGLAHPGQTVDRDDRGPATIGELAEPFAMSFAAAAKHVKVLEQAGLLSRTIEGRSHRCRIEAGPLATADRWLAYYERFWSLRLDDLERALTRNAPKRSRK